MGKRAIDAEQKAQRRQSILAAASRLYFADPSTLPSVATIATEAGLAKGTVYLYFKTKEEIFLALLAELFCDLLNNLNLLLDEPDTKLEQIPQVLIAWIETNPAFLPLASRANSILEQNLATEIALDFKRELAAELTRSGEQLQQRFQVNGTRLLLETHAILVGTWQMLDWPASLRDHLKQPEFAVFNVSFEETLLDMLQRLWR